MAKISKPMVENKIENSFISEMQNTEFLRKENVENCLKKINNLTSSSNLREEALKKVNFALENENVPELLDALKSPILQISHLIWDFAGLLYLEELNYVKIGSKSDLRFEGMKKLCEFLSKIAQINVAIRENSIETFANLVIEANIEDFYPSNVEKYLKKMSKIGKILSHADLQEIIDCVNAENEQNWTKIQAVQKVNEAVENCDVPKLKLSLEHPDLGLDLKDLSEDFTVHLLCLLREFKSNMSLAQNEDRQLWIDHIQVRFRPKSFLKSN